MAEFFQILSRDYMRNAFIVGITMAISLALLGVSLVLKKHSMIGDGLSHVGFGAVAVAVCFGFTPIYFAIPMVILASFLILYLANKSKVFADSAIAIFSTLALAIGYAAIELGEGINFNLGNYLYGSLLGVNLEDVILSICVFIVVVLVFILLYNRIFTVTFDETFSKSTGTKTTLMNIIISVLTSVTIVVGMKLMGALLITSLIIFPVLSARQIVKTFKKVTIFSVIFGALSFTIGLLICSIVMNLPIGSSIVFTSFILCMICLLIGKIMKKKC
ncbi:MAG: metal ABC transporter permease [Acholeplasmatales bacterium]|nr:metal ABC transporter permease [Acholeplasmatales bacterium]